MLQAMVWDFVVGFCPDQFDVFGNLCLTLARISESLHTQVIRYVEYIRVCVLIRKYLSVC